MRSGTVVLAIGVLALGLTSIVFRVFLPGLQPLPESWAVAGMGPILTGLVLVIGATGLVWRWPARAGASLALYWAMWLLIAHAPQLIATPADATVWVSASQVLTLAAVGLTYAWPGRPAAWRGLRIAAGLMLVLFGGVHLAYPAAIADLLPPWFPMAEVWPRITGALQIAAGLAVLSGLFGRWAALGVAAMFLAWVPLVHLARLVAQPADAFEWTFMATAVALAGALLRTAADPTPRSPVAPKPARPAKTF